MTRCLVPLFLSLVAGAYALPAQVQVALTKPIASFPDPFTRLSGLRELPDGRVLVSDLQDKVVQLLDFRAGSATKVGREGQGPGEYALPAGLIGLPNGQTLVHDLLGRRFLTIEPDGKTGAAVPLPTGHGGFVALGPQGVAADGKGRLYFQAPPFNVAKPDGAQPDSLAILRWDRVKPNLDTVAWIVGPKGSFSASGSGTSQRVSIRLGGGKVFSPQEAWGVAGDGSVARVRPNPYQVLWYPPNATQPAPGPVQPYSPLKVTDQDQKDYLEAQKKVRPMMIAIGGGGRAPAVPPNIQLPTPEFETIKPPFTGTNAVVVSPEGEVWVKRTAPAGDPIPIYDVFDRSGRVIKRVSLNPKSVVFGFGKGTVYVIQADDDDLQHLQRFAR